MRTASFVVLGVALLGFLLGCGGPSQEEFDNLKKENGDLKANLDKTNQALAGTTKDRDEANTAIAKLKDELTAKANELTAAAGDKTGLEAKVEEVAKALEAAVAEKEKLAGELGAAQAALEAARTASANLEAEVQKAKSEAENLSLEVSKAKAELAKKTEEATALAKEIETLKAKIKELEKKKPGK
jgi:chromosome segregation ATPase